jgi:F0F1-type ATP synthase assembly protein I
MGAEGFLPDEQASPRRPRRGKYQKLAELSSLGLVLPSSIAVGMVLGYLLDRLFGTHPWLLGAFTVLGIASGLLNLVRSLQKIGVEKDNDDEP